MMIALGDHRFVVELFLGGMIGLFSLDMFTLEKYKVVAIDIHTYRRNLSYEYSTAFA
jgi:hypothetical protein